MIIVVLIYLAIIVLMVASIWKVFEKAGQPGWAAIVPFYNLYILTVVAKKEAWWMILFFIPIANLIAAIIIDIEVAKNFGKDTGFAIGMVFLPFIFWPMLAFSDAKYVDAENPLTDEVLDVQ
ncbi:MAG: DUF5684 domain-containing protein [Crocinitomicaceae bacterium]